MSSSVNENIVQLNTGEKIKYASVAQAIEEIRNGKPVVLAEDEGRESEGVLICSAEKATAQIMNLMMHARGMIRVAMLPERAQQLRLIQNNDDELQTPYMISVDAGSEFGVTTGLSANDKAITVQRLTAPNATALDFRRPGHTFPVTANKGGVFRYVDSASAVIDLTRLAGHMPMGVLCEVLAEDGSMAQREDLAAFARKNEISFITISQLIKYRLENEPTITRRVVREIDTRFGTFTAVGYKDTSDNGEHLALVKGSIENLANTTPYVRIQHENLVSDMLGKFSDEMPQEMEQAMQFIQGQETGVVIYLRHSGDSRGLLSALKDYQKTKAETQPGFVADNSIREYGVEAQILADLGVTKIHRLSNSERKIAALSGYGINVLSTISLGNKAPASHQAPKVQTPAAEEEAKAAVVPDVMSKMPNVIMEEDDYNEFVSHSNAPSVTLTEAPVAQNETSETESEKETGKSASGETDTMPELTAEPRKSMTMKMGGQVMKGQALFDSN